MLQLLVWQGWFDTTELYYGTYSCTSITVNGYQYYSIPKAYFLVIFVLFIVYLVVILRRCVTEKQRLCMEGLLFNITCARPFINTVL